jgi:hypothetical protein
MEPYPVLGVFHWLGGSLPVVSTCLIRGEATVVGDLLASGFFSWIICPSLFAGILTKDIFGVLQHQSLDTLWWTYFFGALWGFGGVTFEGRRLANGIQKGRFASKLPMATPHVWHRVCPLIYMIEDKHIIGSLGRSKMNLPAIFFDKEHGSM